MPDKKNDKTFIRYRRGHGTAAFCRDMERNFSEEPGPKLGVASPDTVWFSNAESFNRMGNKIGSKPS